MDAVGFQRVGAAALLRAGLGLDPGDRHRRVRAALALGRGGGGDGPGRLPGRPRAARPPRRADGGGAGRGQPDAALVLAGGARLRAAALLCAALAALLRARRASPGAAADFVLWGVVSALALATHYFAVFPLVAEVVLLLRRRRGERPAAGSGSSPSRRAAGAAGDPPDVLGHAEWIGNFTPRPPALGNAATFVTGETGDIIGQPERPALAFVPLALLRSPPSPCSPGAATATSAARRRCRFCVAAGCDRGPAALALGSRRQGLRPRPQPDAGAGAAAGRASRSRLTVARARRLGAAVAVALSLYSLGFCVCASTVADLQRPDWDAVAERLGEPDAAAGDGHLGARRGAAALLPLDRRDPGASLGRLPTGWSAKSTFVSARRGAAAAGPPARPRLPRSRPRSGRPRCSSAATAARSGPGAAAAARPARRADRISETTASS